MRSRRARRWIWWVAAVFTSVLLPLLMIVDLDGDPSTANLPDVVLVNRVVQGQVGDQDAGDAPAEAPLARQAGRRAAQFVRRAERWTVLFRRFHRSIVNDIPI